MQNKQNQGPLKTLRVESTITKHQEAFSGANSNMLDVLRNQDCDLQQLQYNTMPAFFPNGSYGLHSYAFPFSNLFSGNQTIAEQLIQTSNQIQPISFGALPLKHLAAEGMRIVCEIDIIMLKNYYDLREQIFNKHNQSAPKRMDNKSNQIEWIKGRFQYRFKDNISKMLCSLVDEVKNLHNNKTEDGQAVMVEKIRYEPQELYALDKEMKEKNQQMKDYLDPQEVCRRIIKLIETYIKTSSQ